MLPVLKIAGQREAKISDAVDTLAKDLAISEDGRAHLLPSGNQTTFANRVHWAKSYLAKAGLVKLTRRAHFEITDDGRKVLADAPNRIDIKYLYRFPAFQRFRVSHANGDQNDGPASLVAETESILTPDEVMRNAHHKLEAALADELIQRIHSGTPAFFESLVVRLLVSMGYGGSVTDVNKALVGGTGDGGVDGVIDHDQLSVDRIYVQAKRYADGNTVVAGANSSSRLTETRS